MQGKCNINSLGLASLKSSSKFWSIGSVSSSLVPEPDYSVHGIFQARLLEWVAISFSRGSSQSRDQTQVSRIAGGFFTVWATAAAAAESLQSCLTLCDPIDGSPPGSPVPGILQARTLEWVAISFEPLGKSNCYKTSHQNLLGWDTSHFERQGLIAWQSNKALLFYFTQNSVSEIWFGTSAQRASVLASHSYLQSLVILLVIEQFLLAFHASEGTRSIYLNSASVCLHEAPISICFMDQGGHRKWACQDIYLLAPMMFWSWNCVSLDSIFVCLASINAGPN